MADVYVAISLDEVNALVAKYVTEVFPVDVLDRNPGVAPDYCNWPYLGAVIQAMELKGYWVTVESKSGLGNNPDLDDASFHKAQETADAGYSTGTTIPIAVCCAALATVGHPVRLESK